MMKKRFTEQQIAFALRQTTSGMPLAEVIRKMWVSEATSRCWKEQFAWMVLAANRRGGW